MCGENRVFWPKYNHLFDKRSTHFCNYYLYYHNRRVPLFFLFNTRLFRYFSIKYTWFVNNHQPSVSFLFRNRPYTNVYNDGWVHDPPKLIFRHAGKSDRFQLIYHTFSRFPLIENSGLWPTKVVIRVVEGVTTRLNRA